jgi:hypothetical protein
VLLTYENAKILGTAIISPPGNDDAFATPPAEQESGDTYLWRRYVSLITKLCKIPSKSIGRLSSGTGSCQCNELRNAQILNSGRFSRRVDRNCINNSYLELGESLICNKGTAVLTSGLRR